MDGAVIPHEVTLLDAVSFADRIEEVAPLVVQMAEADHFHDDQDIARMVLLGRLQFWLVTRAGAPIGAWTTEIVDYPKCRSLVFQQVAGRGFRGWADTRQVIYAWAREQGCIRAVGATRRGFARLMPELRGILHVYEAELS